MDDKKNKKLGGDDFSQAYNNVITGSGKEMDWQILFDNLFQYEAEKEDEFKFNLLSSKNGVLEVQIPKLDISKINTDVDYIAIEKGWGSSNSDDFVMNLMKSSGNLEKNLFLSIYGDNQKNIDKFLKSGDLIYVEKIKFHEEKKRKELGLVSNLLSDTFLDTDFIFRNFFEVAYETGFNIVPILNPTHKTENGVEFDEKIRFEYSNDVLLQNNGGIIYDYLPNLITYEPEKIVI